MQHASGRNIIKLKFYFSESKRFYPHLNRTEIEPFDISSMSDQDRIFPHDIDAISSRSSCRGSLVDPIPDSLN